MLEDIITLILGFSLILLGLEPMMYDVTARRAPTMVIKSVLMILGGMFLMYYWNLNTKANYAY
jgi:hypothetical protein